VAFRAQADGITKHTHFRFSSVVSVISVVKNHRINSAPTCALLP